MAQRTVPPDIAGFAHQGWIGGGGFADVFRYQDAMGRSVAVKVQHRGIDSGTSTAFQSEANVMAKLSTHPNIVTIHTSGVAHDGRPYLVMEECSTAHLGARIAKRTQSVAKAMEVTIQVAGAVETAHRMGILHRDIKPANILFTEFGRPALTDFGISVSGEQVEVSGGLSPLWAPPEQYPDSGMPMGPWSDVFSLAATMWAMLTGRSPLEVAGGANDRLSLRHRARTFTPVPTGRADVPETLERVLLTALARDPSQRYRSMIEFARAIQGVQGQLNLSVTQIDVLDDYAETHGVDEDSGEDTGTRVSGFMLIDPEAVQDATVTGTLGASTTGSHAGLTSDHSWDTGGSTGDSGPPAVAQYGRGYAEPGLRDFTAPALPTDQAPERARQHIQPQETATPERRRSPLVGVVASTAVALLAAGGMWSSGILEDDPVESPSESVAPVPQDPTAVRVPPVEDLEGVLEGENAIFTWTNPDPRESDTYFVETLSTAIEEPTSVVDDMTVTVEAQPGQTCINVSLRRGSGQLSTPVRACVAS